ncbi:MAG: hypothetical protein DRG11_05835 [Epsilonproteobacteria bacterium]|nr:MAG: hypothetical protein DRG11_05835 [Campylobacterota bacterium]
MKNENLSGTRLKSDISMLDIVGNIIVWVLLSVVTFGLAMFVFLYFYNKMVINHTFVVDKEDNKIGKLSCDIGVGQAIGHGFIWFVITIVTFGFGIFFYMYKANAYVMSQTKVEMYDK